MIYLNDREKSVESEKNSRKYAKKSESDPFFPPDQLCPTPPYIIEKVIKRCSRLTKEKRSEN